MLTTSIDHKSVIEPLLATERKRLVNFCTGWTGNREVAEDLAQETLIIAWQQQQRLRKTDAPAHWLTGIARNLCRHWQRSSSRESARRIDADLTNDDEAMGLSPISSASFDVTAELNQTELAHLLDHALAKLPPLTRTVLVERFIYDTPQVEVAQRLGVTEGAVEARVQRGKDVLRRVLTTDLHEEAVAYGLAWRTSQGWQETKLWCPACGERRLRGYFSADEPRTCTLRCDCGLNSCVAGIPNLFAGIHGFRAAATRMTHWQHGFYEQGVQTGQVTCPLCGGSCTFQLEPNVVLSQSAVNEYGYRIICTACQAWQRQADLGGIAINFPVVQQFWRHHPRMVSLPIRSVEVEGATALLASFVDRQSAARIELLFQHSTLALLPITK